MKKSVFVLVGLPVLLALLFAACVDPIKGVNSGITRARVAEMPLVDLSLFPDEYVFYSNQPIGLLTLPLDKIKASVGTLSFQWLVSEYSNGANAVEISSSASQIAAYGTGWNANTFFLSLAPGEEYYANVGVRYYALRITNTYPAPSDDYAPAVYITPFVKVTIRPPFETSKITSVNADGVPYTDTTTEVYVNFVDDPGVTIPTVVKEDIVIYGNAAMGDGEISLTGTQLTVPLKNISRGKILLAIKGVAGIEECFYTASIFDDTPLLYGVSAYQKLGVDKTDIGTNRLKLEFNLPVDLAINEIILGGGITHAIPSVDLVRNDGGMVWVVAVDAATIDEGYTTPSIRLETTVGVVGAEALGKSIPGVQACPSRLEW